MTTREQLLQELTTTSDEVLQPVLEFLLLLKAHPQHSHELHRVFGQTFKLLEQQPSYEQWLATTQEKVAIALAQIERGEVVDGEVAIASLQDKINQARRATS